MIDPNVHRGYDNVVIGMLQFSDTLGEVACLVVVDVGERGDTIWRFLAGNTCMRKFVAQHVTNSFRAVLITALSQQAVELIGQFVT